MQVCLTITLLAASSIADFQDCSEFFSNGQGDATASSSLLASRFKVGSVVTLSDHLEAIHAWQASRTTASLALKNSRDFLDDFVESNKQLSRHCVSGLHELKHSLDGLLEELTRMSAQVASHQQFFAEEANDLQIILTDIDVVNKEHETTMTKCNMERQRLFDEIDQCTAELDKLQFGQGREVAPSGTVVATVKEWTPDQCKAFAVFVKSHMRHRLRLLQASNINVDDKSCDEHNEAMHKAFVAAGSFVQELKQKATRELEDDQCAKLADAWRTSKVAHLHSKRDQAGNRMQNSMEKLAELHPILQLIKDRVTQLQEKGNEMLTPDCLHKSQVSKYFNYLHEFIALLGEAPADQDMALTITKEARRGKRKPRAAGSNRTT